VSNGGGSALSDVPLVLATRSVAKMRELRPILAAAGLAVADLDEAGVPADASEEAIESFDTFEENAVAKARWFHGLLPARTVVADDSGLEVLALGGRPGVRSKRWSGRDDLSGVALDDANNGTLQAALQGAEDRRARYVCVAALVGPGGELVRRGEVEGRILELPRGTGGFGYDPWFACDELGGRTFAEVSLDEKARVSHRGRAFRALIRAMCMHGSG